MLFKPYICKKCKHKWFPRIPSKPRMCPFCKSYKWDEPRKGDNK